MFGHEKRIDDLERTVREMRDAHDHLKIRFLGVQQKLDCLRGEHLAIAKKRSGGYETCCTNCGILLPQPKEEVRATPGTMLF